MAKDSQVWCHGEIRPNQATSASDEQRGKKQVGCDFCSDGVGGTSLLEMEAISPQTRAR